MKIDEIFKKYGKKLDSEIKTEAIDVGEFSTEYLQFKKDMMPSLSRYEKLCKGLGSIIKLDVSKKDEIKIQKNLDAAHLEVMPSQVLALALVSMLLMFFIGILITALVYFATETFSLMLLFLSSSNLFNIASSPLEKNIK